jgi:hypothetical protein
VGAKSVSHELKRAVQMHIEIDAHCQTLFPQEHTPECNGRWNNYGLRHALPPTGPEKTPMEVRAA